MPSESASILPDHQSRKWEVIMGDCEHVMLDLPGESVDLCITDPPYGSKYLDCYRKLRSVSRLLKPGGSLLVLTGQVCFLQIAQILSASPALRYHWLCSAQMDPDSTHSQIRSHRVSVGHKPILWYVKGKYNGPYVRDALPLGVNIQKVNHIWEQPLDWTNYYIDKLTRPGDLVLDPFAGSGSTGLSALSLDRRFLGIELGKKHVIVAQKRLADEQTKLAELNGSRRFLQQDKHIYDSNHGWPYRNR